MTRSQLALVLGLVALVVLAGLLAEPEELGPTTYGGQGAGLLSAWEYLAARGHPVERWEQPLEALPVAEGALVIAAPFAQPWTEADTRAVRTWADQGGTVVVASSGGAPRSNEAALLEAFGLVMVERRDDAPPLSWPGWQAWRLAETTAHPVEAGWPAALVIRRETHGPRVPADARPLYVDEAGQALAWALPWGAGEVVVLANASPLGNAGLGRGGNLAVLERLLAARGPVRFDEWHHGHRAAGSADLAAVVGPFELLMAHLALLYLLAAWALGRRFGPPLADGPPRQGSVARDLRLLARLHRRSGHAAQAGQRLLQLAHDLARRRGAHPPALPARFEGGEAELLDLARTVGRLQGEGHL